LSAAPYERSLSVTIFLGAPCFLITFLRQFLPKQKSWQAEDWLVYQNGLEALIENLEVNNKSDRNELRFIYSIEEEKKDFLELLKLLEISTDEIKEYSNKENLQADNPELIFRKDTMMSRSKSKYRRERSKTLVIGSLKDHPLKNENTLHHALFVMACAYFINT